MIISKKMVFSGTHCILCELKKDGNRDSIINLSKSKRKMIIFLSVDDSIFIFHHMVHLPVFDHSYWVRDGCSAIIFVKHVKTVFVQVHNAVWLHELLFLFAFLVRAPANAIIYAAQTTPTVLHKTILTCFTKLIAVQPSSVAEYELTMYIYQMKLE